MARVALREIADATIGVDDLEDELIKGLQRHADTDEPGEETTELLAMEEELSGAVDTFGAGLDMADDDDDLDDSDLENARFDDEADQPED